MTTASNANVPKVRVSVRCNNSRIATANVPIPQAPYRQCQRLIGPISKDARKPNTQNPVTQSNTVADSNFVTNVNAFMPATLLSRTQNC
jgi:hypothetical protein